MNPDQISMLSIKAAIDHIVSTYIALYDETTYQNKISDLLEDLVKANKLKSYHVQTLTNQKIDITFNTPLDHGCTLTFIFKDIKGNKFVPYNQFTTTSDSLINKIINADNGDFKLSNPIRCVVHTDEQETSAIQDIAIWQTAFHKDKTVHIIIPFGIDIDDYANQILHKCKNLAVNKQSLGNVISFPNKSKIIINSLCSRTSFTNIDELVLLDIYGDWYKSCLVSDMANNLYKLLSELQLYNANQLLIASCNNWKVFDTITQLIYNKQSMRVAFSDLGAALYYNGEH